MQRIKIVSTGLYLPSKIQTSKELAPLIGRSEKWIISRTGVEERRIAEESMDIIAAKAAKEALDNGPAPDCILNASTTPLQLIPDSSVFIQKALGLKGIPSWSIHATCLSFVTALMTAASFIESKLYKRILIVSAETGTGWRNMKQPESAALFGDGAAAVVVESTPDPEESGIVDWEMNTWPEGADMTEFRGGGTRRPPYQPGKSVSEDYLFNMKGPRVYRMAREKVKDVLTTLFERNNISAKDIDWAIPHQASGRVVEAAVEYGLNRNRVVNIAAKYGNCIAASMPMALVMTHKQGKLKRGDLLLLGGTGAGLSVAFAMVRW